MERGRDSFSCIFCSRGFARSDALKRHYTTCKTRIERHQDVPVLQLKSKGRKLRACDRCSQLKRACTASTPPCQPCAQRQLPCKYTRRASSPPQTSNTSASMADNTLDSSAPSELVVFEQNSANYEPITTEFPDTVESILQSCWDTTSGCGLRDYDVSLAVFDEYTLATSLFHRPTQINVDVLIKFPFMMRFTSTRGLIDSFECGQKGRQSLSLQLVRPRRPVRPTSYFQPEQPQAQWIEIDEAAFPSYDTEGMADKVRALFPKAHEIVAQIEAYAVPRKLWTIPFQTSCYEFFHPSRIEKYLAMYWTFWHPHNPVIHLPSFDPVHKPPLLIAAMMIVGACLSSNNEDKRMAQQWFDVLEEKAFDSDVFEMLDPSVAWQEPTNAELQELQLTTIQTAWCIICCQTWEGSDRSRRRIMRQRYCQLTSFAREIGFENASLKTVNTTDILSFSWKEYILRESLIRAFNFICNLDSAYAFFFREPPRVMVTEMHIDLTSPETCFCAPTSELCLLALQTFRATSTTHFTIFSAMETLFDTSLPSSASTHLHNAFIPLSVFNMFTLISVLYTSVFSYETNLSSLLPASCAAPLLTGLARWKELWPSPARDQELVNMQNLEVDAAHSWRRIGFIKHAPEYWYLTQLIVEDMVSAGGRCRGRNRMARRDGEGIRELSEIIAEFQRGRGVR